MVNYDEFETENENVSENENIIVLSDENGNDVKFEFLDLIEYNDKEYAVLLPVYEGEDDQVVILQFEETDEENEVFTTVEDEGILQAVFEIFKNNFSKFFDFTD